MTKLVIADIMTWKAFWAVFGLSLLFALRKALVRVSMALVDAATEKLVLKGLQRLAKSTKNDLDDEIVKAVEVALQKKS